MRLGGTARYLVELTDKAALPGLSTWAKEHGVDIIMIGVGSNIIWRDEGFGGLVIINKLLGFDLQEDSDDVLVTIAAGENWDGVAERCAGLELNGISELSLIPGTAGATPIQNVGAYGREIADVLVEVEAFDQQTGAFVTLANEECGFGYRTSRFKTTDRGRFLITSIMLQLSRSMPQPPYYQAVDEYLTSHGITVPSVRDIRDAIVAIRSAKLPDPMVVANNGSFFANPVVSSEEFAPISGLPGIKHWQLDDGMVKLSAAWLIEAAGFKNYHDAETGMATWPSQPLVFINESAKNTRDVLKFKKKVVDAVRVKFSVELQQEPELLPLTID